MSNKILKFIPTVLGKISSSFLLSQEKIDTNKPKITTLPYEHLIQNLCDYLHPISGQESKDSITLSNLSIIIKNPFSFYQNLTLEPDEVKLSSYLTRLSNEYNTKLFCDVTNKKNGNNLLSLIEISKISKVSICTGVSLDYSYTDIKQYSNDLRYELLYGLNDKYIPAFIGEQLVNTNFPKDKKEEELFEMVINDIINVHETPMFVKLNHLQKNINTNTIIPWLKTKNVKKKSKIVFEISIGDYDNFENIETLISTIVQSGYSVVIGLFDCDLEDEEKIKNNPIDHYFSLSKGAFIRKLIQDSRQYIDKIMISNNINFKIQLKDYGGFGYENIFENYYKYIVENLSQKEIDLLFSQNLISLLEWWKEPEKSVKKAKMIKCETCGAEREEDDKEIFRKFDKTFCSFGCLKKYLNSKK